jgi:hypothetical protein
MVWTNDKIHQLPEIYRDFMLVLKPVIDSRKPNTILRITGIPFGQLAGILTWKHGYNTDQVRQVADNLRRGDYVTEDQLGFFQPTGKGEDLILAMTNEGQPSEDQVPPLPIL